MPRFVPVVFTAVCVTGAAMLVYFAQLSALQSIPAYSTLSSKPEGAKLLFDGLSKVGAAKVSRQFKPVSLQKPVNAVVFFLGVRPSELEAGEQSYFDEMERSARAGNRLVIGVTKGPAKRLVIGGPDSRAVKVDETEGTTLFKRWGINFVPSKDDSLITVPKLDKSWQSLPEAGSEVWQRKFGKGAIVFVGHTDRLNNKGIATSEGNRRVLRHLLGDYGAVVFEEAHLGIQETGSIAGLARHYHLQGLLAGLILVAALFVWSRSISFPPAPPTTEKLLVGSDTRSMLRELMSRHLKGNVLAICVAEWNRTSPRSPSLEVPEGSDVLAAYSKLQRSLQEKAKFRP